MPQSTAKAIFQDSKGFIWIGTYDGLTRFDGYRFVNFKSDPADPTSLSNNIVVSIVEDQQGFLWVGTAQNGVNRFDPATGKFTRFASEADDFDSLSSPQIHVVHEDSQGRIWVGTNQGLDHFLPEKQAFSHFVNNPLDSQSLPDGPIVDIVDDGKGNLWVAGTEVVAHFNVEQQIFTYLNGPDAPSQINKLYLDTDGSLWVGTRFDGLYHRKADSKNFVHYKHNEKDPNSLSSNDVRAILRAQNGDLWVGTEEGGLNVRRKGDKIFQHFQRNSADRHSLAINDVWTLMQDRSGQIWVGTAGGGINLTMSYENRFSRLTHSPGEVEGLSHQFVWDVEEDNQGNIWFATLNGIDNYDPLLDTYEHYRKFVTADGFKVGNRIQAIALDLQGRIWFGNQQGQVAVFNRETGTTRLIERDGFQRGVVSSNRIRMVEADNFGNIWIGTDDGLIKISAESGEIIEDYNLTGESQLGNTLVRTMFQDENGIIWFGTWNKGIQRYDPEFNTVTSFENNPEDPESLSDNVVRSIYQDGEGNLWIGTFNGLNLLSKQEIDAQTYRFKSFLEKDGLPNTTVYSIVGAPTGKLWLSTNKGLSEFDPIENVFQNFTIEDGITSNEFNGDAAIRSQNDEIYFGSVNGVTIVNPAATSSSSFKPQVVITGFNIQDTPYLGQGVSYENQALNLNYKENDVTIEFASLDFRHPKRNRFQFRLLPYNDEWTQSTEINHAVFTNLDPNQYIFELKATNSDGIWVDDTVRLAFTIHPPMWKTWWAKFIYFALTISLIAFFLNRQEKSLQEQMAINEHLRRVDELKDEFLANTSHELRTPLNGIIGIAESLREGVAGLQNQKTLNHLQLIIDGGKRLSQLVNDILDFKKLSHHNLVLQRKAVDLSSIVNVVLNLLQTLADDKKLQINNAVPGNLPLIYADENRIQQVLHNLIGNAIKYTKKGRIEITASSKNNFVEICVSDTGMGIADEDLQKIFEPFEQAELSETISHRGTGLGLSVSHQLVEEHGGRLWATSKINEGSQFYFNIPVWLENIHEEKIIESIKESKPNQLPHTKLSDRKISKPDSASLFKGKKKGKVLIADDDPINLQVLSDLLHMNGYQVASAENGLKAVELGESEKFDLAILDIMMPGLSGYDVCKKLREKYSAIELPILLLSARNQPGDISAGFEVGANDYVAKPIEREVLLSRIHTMSLLGGLVEAKQQKEHATTLQQACERLGRYFPKQMVNQIITNNDENVLLAQRRLITVVFADLAGFTAISDRFEPESITAILNGFLGKMGQLIEDKNGILNEILGDGLVVLFGALDNMDKTTQAQSAAALALEMQAAMNELSEEWLEQGIDHNVKLRIGIHQDFATVGNFGSKDIVAFRAVGSGVNLAARLENYSPSGKITVSYPIYAQCKNDFEFTELEEVQFKGFNHPHRVCQLAGNKSD
nr:two-component regulator propeller domain-containing protein [Aliikangiella sp. G2MR2-5]